MASSPDLFVVCKNCGSEVSPYITECPYCGTRLRKRAPKIERDGTVSEPKPKKQKKQRAPRVRRERPSVGAAVDRRPYATLALVLLSLFGYLMLSVVEPADIAVAGPIDGEWWRVASTLFLYGSPWYELAAVLAIGIYGWLLEMRHGPFAVIGLFAPCGAAGAALTAVIDPPPPAPPCPRSSPRRRWRAAATAPGWACCAHGPCRTSSPARAGRSTTATCS